MSHAQILAATQRVQEYTAQAKGMAAGAGNTLFAGDPTPYTGVYGHPRVIFIPNPRGAGYVKKTEVDLRITKGQRDSIPAFGTPVVRTDLTPNVTYKLDHAGTHDEFWWVIVLAQFGPDR